MAMRAEDRATEGEPSTDRVIPGFRKRSSGLRDGADRDPSRVRDAASAARGRRLGASALIGLWPAVGRPVADLGRGDPADDRVRAYRRRRREVVVFNEKVRGVLGLLAGACAAAWLAFGAVAPWGGATASIPIWAGVVTGAAWMALHLLTRQVERGRWFLANATLSSVLFPFCRDAARRARLLCRDARVLRRRGLSLA